MLGCVQEQNKLNEFLVNRCLFDIAITNICQTGQFQRNACVTRSPMLKVGCCLRKRSAKRLSLILFVPEKKKRVKLDGLERIFVIREFQGYVYGGLFVIFVVSWLFSWSIGCCLVLKVGGYLSCQWITKWFILYINYWVEDNLCCVIFLNNLLNSNINYNPYYYRFFFINIIHDFIYEIYINFVNWSI